MRPRSAPAAGRYRRWLACALLAALVSAGTLATVGLRQYVEPALLLLAGVVCWAAGRLGSVPAYRYLGTVMAAAAIVVGAQSTGPGTQPSLAGVMIFDAVLTTVVVPAAFLINSHYLWGRFD